MKAFQLCSHVALTILTLVTSTGFVSLLCGQLVLYFAMTVLLLNLLTSLCFVSQVSSTRTGSVTQQLRFAMLWTASFELQRPHVSYCRSHASFIIIY